MVPTISGVGGNTSDAPLGWTGGGGQPSGLDGLEARVKEGAVGLS